MTIAVVTSAMINQTMTTVDTIRGCYCRGPRTGRSARVPGEERLDVGIVLEAEVEVDHVVDREGRGR